MIQLLDLLHHFGDEVYQCLDIPDIGALYNTHHSARSLLRGIIENDTRIIPMTEGEFGCECNICDYEQEAIVTHPISMRAVFRSPTRIQLLCDWYYSILLR
jgi:hypothetical protein